MYIKDGIAYAGEPEPPILVTGVRPLAEHKLWLRFSTNETKLYDCTPLLDYPVFAPLADEALFGQAYLDGWTVCWPGEIDIAPETLYEMALLWKKIGRSVRWRERCMLEKCGAFVISHERSAFVYAAAG